MDKISDILNSVKERLSNPFFLAFILAWIAWNPTVTVALIWYDPKQIALAGYANIFDLIGKNSDNWKSIWWPLISAVLYTGLFRNGVMLWTTWSNKWGDWLDLRISKGSTIPMSKYLSLKDDYEERTKVLETVIKDESKTIESFNAEKTKRLELEDQVKKFDIDKSKIVSDYEDQLRKIGQENTGLQRLLDGTFDIRFLKGTWKCHYPNNLPDPLIVEIDQNKINIHDKNGDIRRVYTIHNFTYDIRSQSMWFLKALHEPISKLTPTLVYTLNSIKGNAENIFVSLAVLDSDTLTGTENESVKVTYSRIKP